MTQNAIEVYVRDFPGDRIRLEFTKPTPWSQAELTKFAVDSFFSFINGWVEILSADLAVTFYDIKWHYPKENIRPSQEFWMLKKIQMDPQVAWSKFWKNEIIVDADEITSLSVREWIANALAANESVDPLIGLTWERIMFSTANCNSGLSEAGRSNLTISVTEGASKYQHPFETKDGNIWITGPLQKKSLYAPIEFTLINDTGVITFDIAVYWSLWSKEGMPGTLKVQESVNKLLQQGWEYPSY